MKRTRRIIWPVSNAHAAGQLIRVTCGYCPGERYYLPNDVVQVFGDIDIQKLAYRIRCERCGRGDNIDAEAYLPVAAERMGIKVRRLVEIKVRRIPVWADEAS